MKKCDKYKKEQLYIDGTPADPEEFRKGEIISSGQFFEGYDDCENGTEAVAGYIDACIFPTIDMTYSDARGGRYYGWMPNPNYLGINIRGDSKYLDVPHYRYTGPFMKRTQNSDIIFERGDYLYIYDLILPDDLDEVKSLFYYCEYVQYINLKNVDLNRFDNFTQFLRNAGWALTDNYCTVVWPENFNFSNVKYMDKMFYAAVIEDLSLIEKADMSNVITMDGTFQYLYSKNTYNLSGWNLENVTSMNNAFYETANRSKFTNLKLNTLKSIKYMNYAFYKADIELVLENASLTNLEEADYAFYGHKGLHFEDCIFGSPESGMTSSSHMFNGDGFIFDRCTFNVKDSSSSVFKSDAVFNDCTFNKNNTQYLFYTIVGVLEGCTINFKSTSKTSWAFYECEFNNCSFPELEYFGIFMPKDTKKGYVLTNCKLKPGVRFENTFTESNIIDLTGTNMEDAALDASSNIFNKVSLIRCSRATQAALIENANRLNLPSSMTNPNYNTWEIVG